MNKDQALKKAKRDYIMTPPNQAERRDELAKQIFRLAEGLGRPIRPDHR